MLSKNINTRIQNKHDTEANWSQIHWGFTPLAGELIIYDPDENHSLPRFKIGDGVTQLESLKFTDPNIIKEISGASTGKKYCLFESQVWDSIIAIDIIYTTNVVARGTLIIATQNYEIRDAILYGDEEGILSESLKIIPSQTTNPDAEQYRKINIYYDLPAWAYGYVTIKYANLNTTPSQIITEVESIPTTTGYQFTTPDSDIQEHITDTNNPHNVTKEQIGLGNVPNVNCQNAGNITSGYLNANRLISDPGAYYINPKLASSSYVLGELGTPCAFEAAVVESSLANQLRFFPIENLKFETLTAEATEWADVTDSISEDTKKEFVNGLSNTYLESITLSKGIQGYRIIIEPKEYTILSALYLFISTQGHQCKIKIESQIGNIEEWIVEQESSNAFNTWPGHVWFQHGNIPFNPSPYEGSQHRTKLRVTLTPVWGNSTQDILLYHINWYGGYPPSTSRYIYTWDKNKVVYFPGDIRSRDGYLYSTKDSRNIILQPLKLVRDNNIEINWPSKAGTFALTDDITSAMTNIKIDDGEL